MVSNEEWRSKLLGKYKNWVQSKRNIICFLFFKIKTMDTWERYVQFLCKSRDKPRHSERTQPFVGCLDTGGLHISAAQCEIKVQSQMREALWSPTAFSKLLTYKRARRISSTRDNSGRYVHFCRKNLKNIRRHKWPGKKRGDICSEDTLWTTMSVTT